MIDEEAKERESEPAAKNGLRVEVLDFWDANDTGLTDLR